MRFLELMQTPSGCTARVAGGALLVWSGAKLSGLLGVLLMMFGLIPLVGGLANVCLLAEIVHAVRDSESSPPARAPASADPHEHRV